MTVYTPPIRFYIGPQDNTTMDLLELTNGIQVGSKAIILITHHNYHPNDRDHEHLRFFEHIGSGTWIDESNYTYKNDASGQLYAINKTIHELLTDIITVHAILN